MQTPADVAARRKHAREVVIDVLTVLEGQQSVRTEAHTSPRLIGGDFLASGLDAREAMRAAHTLFGIALTELNKHGKWAPTEIAMALNAHILDDVGEIILETISEARTSTQEVVNAARIADLLSHREIEVFEYITRQASTKEIAQQMGIAEHTVKHHITNIGRKLQASGRQGLLARARELGLLIATPVAVGGAITAISTLT
ncbi:helix-turn-helix transcriptional regulator [Rathayibacter sp. CAU 1779]